MKKLINHDLKKSLESEESAIMNWKCFFGFHDWKYYNVRGHPIHIKRACQKCRRRQALKKCPASDQIIWFSVMGSGDGSGVHWNCPNCGADTRHS